MIVVLQKTPWNPVVAFYIPLIKYIYLIYIYLFIIIIIIIIIIIYREDITTDG